MNQELPPFQKSRLRILLIEDNPDDQVLLEETLKGNTNINFEIFSQETLSQGIDFLKNNVVDAILLDLSLPDSSGLATFNRINENAAKTPVIILSGLANETIAVTAVREGAQDYLVKGEITASLVTRSILYAIERKETRARLRESEDRAGILIEKNSDGILLVDQKGNIKFTNPKAEALFGRSSTQLIGSPFGFPVSGTRPVEIDVINKGTVTKIVEMSCAKVDVNNEPFHLASLRDITERKEAEIRLEKKNQDLIVLNDKLEAAKTLLKKKTLSLEKESLYKSQFLANMSHELRSPLNSVILLSENLFQNQEKNLDKEQIKFAKIINNSGKDLLELINEILDFSKMEAGKMKVFVSQIHLNELAENIELAYQSLAKKKGLGFNVSIAGSLPEHITTDRQKVEQIIRNLISNALKFTEQGQIQVTIGRVSPEMEINLPHGIDPQKHIAISVTDTGIGVPKKYRDQIFQAFQQVDGSAAREYGGTGLGLSISKQLALLLKGGIHMESRHKKGSCFTLYLPEALDISETVTQDRRKDQRSDFKKQDPVNIPNMATDKLTGCKILIVDDDMRNLFSMTTILEKNKILVEKAQSGQKALQFVQALSDIDLILMDIMMPQMDGYETIRKIREIEKKHIPIIALTATALKKDRGKCLQAGADEYASKPIEMNDLFFKMERLIQKGHP